VGKNTATVNHVLPRYAFPNRFARFTQARRLPQNRALDTLRRGRGQIYGLFADSPKNKYLPYFKVAGSGSNQTRKITVRDMNDS
jgi:hypothetical protein